MEALLADLKSCGVSKDLERGKKVHASVIRTGQDSSVYVASTLVDMYAKCGSMLEAQEVFDKMRFRNVVTWTALIAGYADNGEEVKALELFSRMQRLCPPDAVAFVAVLGACSNLVATKKSQLERCMAIHTHAVKCSLYLDLRVGSKLVSMYSRCGCMKDARMLFDRMPLRNVVVWNALLLGYAENGEGMRGLELLYCMEREGIVPDAVTFIAALKSCTNIQDQKQGDVEVRVMTVHFHSAWRFCDKEIKVASTLVDIYSKCGKLIDARKIFDAMPEKNVVPWTALMLGYAENGDGDTTLELYSLMDCPPDALAFVAALKACSSLSESEKLLCQEKGMIIQSHAVISGLDSDPRVANTLIDMYAKCGSMKDAQVVFDRMPYHDVISWNALILGYVENGQSEVALDLFSRIEGCAPDSITFIAAFKACAALGALEMAREFEASACFDDKFVLANCLVDVYGKCGSMADAQRVFDSISEKCAITWNALLAGYAFHGETGCLFEAFREMQKTPVTPDALTFLCILSACNHAGLVDQGKECFERMSSVHRVLPDIEHYHCMLDMLGRANKLDDAAALIRSMPFSASVSTWRTLLGACQKWKNVNLGKLAFETLKNLGDSTAGNYVSVANMVSVCQ